MMIEKTSRRTRSRDDTPPSRRNNRDDAPTGRGSKSGGLIKMSDELNKSLVTPKFRMSYCHLLEPWASDPDDTPRYSVQCIVPKDDPWVKKTHKLIVAIATEAFGENAAKLLRSGRLKDPFRDGDDEFPDDETYAGSIFFNANGAFADGKGKRPGLYDRKRRNILEMDNPEDYIYSGAYARAEIKFFPFDRAGGRGVACYLFRVQWMAHGDPLSGGRPVSEVFDEIDESDDDDAYADDFDDEMYD